MEKIKAKIKWLSKEQGGRQTLPFGDKYAPIVVVKGMSLHSEDGWSLFVENKEVTNINETIAEVRYLSDKALNNLKKGVEFELFEGNKLVASGIIL